VKLHHHASPIFAISGDVFCNLNVQIYVRVGRVWGGEFWCLAEKNACWRETMGRVSE